MQERPTPARWRDPAWQARVADWTVDQMARVGRPATGAPALTYTSEIAAVFRTPSADGNLFTKCPIPLFAAEARVTRALAGRTPAWVPRVLAIEPEAGWLLMEDFGDRTLGDEPQPEWADGLALHARLQRAWVGRTNELLAAGAQHRPVRALRDALRTLLEVDGLGDRLDPGVRAAWPATCERLQAACSELEAVGLPETLLHGDLHPWNIARTDSGPVLFDWSDAAVGSPFLDLAIYLGRARRAERRALLDPYLNVWADAASRRDLERAATLAMTVGSIYQVLTYQQLAHALAGGEPSEFAGADAGWLENAIRALDDGLDARFGFGEEGSSD